MLRSTSISVLALLVACSSHGATEASTAHAEAPATPAPRPHVDAPPPAPPVAPPPESERAIVAWMDVATRVTVQVVHTARGGGERSGTGVVVSDDGDVLTASHVVAGDGVVHVVRADGTRTEAHVARLDAARDLALLSAPTTSTSPCVAVRVERVARGDWLLCTGYAGETTRRTEPARSIGPVLDAAFDWERIVPGARVRWREPEPTETIRRTLLVECAGAPGMSGGPVLDAHGALVGVVLGDHVVSPLAAAPAFTRSTCSAPPHVEGPLALAERRDEHGEPDRMHTLLAGDAPAAEPSVVGIDLSGQSVHLSGVVVAPELVLTVADDDLATSTLSISELPELRPTFVSSVGELALVRVPGLRIAPLTTPATSPRRGELAIAMTSSGAADVGVIGGADLRPGLLVPNVPFRSGMCGTHYHMLTRATPHVALGVVLAHDIPFAQRGALLVDAEGRPLAMQVGAYSRGVGYAVAWSDALARFSELGSATLRAP